MRAPTLRSARPWSGARAASRLRTRGSLSELPFGPPDQWIPGLREVTESEETMTERHAGEASADHTDLLVIGAGPYAYSIAAYARDNGISTRIVGKPMA